MNCLWFLFSPPHISACLDRTSEFALFFLSAWITLLGIPSFINLETFLYTVWLPVIYHLSSTAVIYPPHSLFWCHSLPEWPWRPPSPLCSTIPSQLQLSLARGNWSLSLPSLPTYHARVDDQEHKLTCLWRFGLFSTRACANIQGRAWRQKSRLKLKIIFTKAEVVLPSHPSTEQDRPLQVHWREAQLCNLFQICYTVTRFVLRTQASQVLTFWPQQWLVFVSNEWMYPSSSWDIHCTTCPNPWG